MSSYDFNLSNLGISLLLTILVYMIIPVVLRLTRDEKYSKKEANKISIINSLVIWIGILILKEIIGEYENDSLSFTPAIFYGGINYCILQWKFKSRNFTYLFMALSFICCVCGWFVGAIIFGFVAFVLAYGGLKISRVKRSWQRIAFYIEAFLGLFIFFSSLHSITLNIGILYVWGFIYSIICMFILHFTVFKKQVYDEDEFNYNDKREKVKKVYCKKCGGVLNKDKRCKKCGKQYFKFNYKILSIILGALLIGLIGLCIYIYMLYDKSVEISSRLMMESINEKNDLEGELNSLKRELNSLNGFRTTYWTKNKLKFFDEKIVFVIEGYGNYFYSYDCMVDNVEGEYTFWAYNKEQAISRGYRQGRCN